MDPGRNGGMGASVLGGTANPLVEGGGCASACSVEESTQVGVAVEDGERGMWVVGKVDVGE